MAAIIKLIDIDEAITNLHYKNKDTLKYKLIHTIRLYYEDEGSAESLQQIDTEELVKALWFTGDDRELIRSKKKNLSSVKSSINADLKRLYQGGKNPQGVIIGQSNVFDMSDEAKDKALGTIADVLKEKGTDTITKIAEVLKAVNDLLSDSGSSLNMQGGSETIDRMKGLILDLSRKIGFSIPGDSDREHAGVSESAMSGDSLGEAGATRFTGYTREEKINEVATGGTDDTSGLVADRTQGQHLLDKIDEIIEDESIDEIGDQIETGGAGAAIDKIEEGTIKKINKYREGAAGIKGQSGRGETKSGAVAEIQDYRQESKTIDEAGPDEILEEDKAIDEIEEVVSDGVAEGQLVAEEESEEIEAEVEVAEVEAEAAITEEVVSDGVAEGQLVAEEESEEIEAEAEVAEVEAEAVPQEEGALVENVVEEGLREKAEILAKLAEAAKVLEKLGPDLSESIYSEKEIKEKANLLSEEFDRDLSIRERFYNQHILTKGGYYITGSKNNAKNELPEQRVYLQDFYIGKFPVTNALFDIFVDKTGYRTTAERQGYSFVYTPRSQRRKNIMTGAEEFIWNKHLQYKKVQGAFWYQPNGPNSSLYNKRRHPVVQVSLEDARAFAAWTGKRIPTEREWEAAARTSHGYMYPWGNQWKDNACNIEKSYFGDTTPIDKYLEFVGESGVADTLGNVLEWTLDIWESPESGEKNTDMYIVKGGSWISNTQINLSARYPMDRNTSSNILGFRCVAI